MRNDTKLNILWDEMGAANSELAAVKVVTDEVAPLIPKIPKDYSTNETDTGLKWIDEKNIYCKVVTGTTSDAETSQYILIDISHDTIISSFGFIGKSTLNKLPINLYVSAARHSYVYDDPTGKLYLTRGSELSACNYFIVLYYTKPAATREPDDEPETKKATKKKTKKEEE